MILTLALVFLVALVIGVPIAFGMGFATVVAIFLDGSFPLEIVPHKMVNAVNSFPLVAVPLFILAGALAGETSIAGRLVRFADALLGHIRGGLGHVNVASSIFFGGISGSAVADTAAIGSLMIPAMEKQGYSRRDAGAITICSSPIGILIPPSIPMVLYGVTVSSSIGALFLAGLVPGVLTGLMLMGAVYAMSRKKGWPQRAQRAPLPELWQAFREAILSLLLPVFLLGAIVTGLTTATEAGVIGVVYAFILGGFVYKDYPLRDFFRIFVDSAINTAIPVFVLSATSVAAWIVAVEQFPQELVGFFQDMEFGRIMVLLTINVFLLFVGMVMDLVPALILFAPILLPVAQAVGVDPIQFGVIMVMNLGVGLVTPPLGLNCFVVAKYAKVPAGEVFRGVFPRVVSHFLAVLIPLVFLPLSLWLPDHLN